MRRKRETHPALTAGICLEPANSDQAVNPRSEPPFEILRSYVDNNWPILPLYPVVDNQCTCSRGKTCQSPGKHPCNANGVNGATIQWRQVSEWWSRRPDSNIGIATGGDAALFVLDIDPRHGGDVTIAELQESHGQLPSTLVVRTGGGGTHHYFDISGSNRLLRNSAGRIGEGIDTRCNGGYVVAPPSVTAAGSYRFEKIYELAPLPTWILDRLQCSPSNASRGQKMSSKLILRDSVPGVPAVGGPTDPEDLDEAVLQMINTPEGSRNERLNRLAFWAGLRIARGQFLETDVVHRLTAAAELSGLDESEIGRTLQSGLTAGMEVG